MAERFNEGVLKQRGYERAVVGADREVIYLGFHQPGHRVEPGSLEPWLLSEVRELRAWLDTVLPPQETKGEST